jgi:hypothetical protein
MLIRHVTSIPEIRCCIATFNDSAKLHIDRVLKILRQTRYWVFDESSKIFGPSKFVGLSDMTFGAYEAAIHGDWSGDRFDGHFTRRAIENASGFVFASAPGLTHELVRWGEHLIRPGVFVGVDESKWAFLKIE